MNFNLQPIADGLPMSRAGDLRSPLQTPRGSTGGLWVPSRPTRAFTMVEVALSLAIVAFAMVAIIGVMPIGLNVQKENREETIVSQDAAVILEAIRGGNSSANIASLQAACIQIQGINASIVPGATATTLDIVRRLSIPRWDTSYLTNLVQAHFRSMSGNLADTASAGSAMAFSYVVTSEVTNFTASPTVPTNGVSYLTNNLFEVKLTFQWPVYDGAPGVFPTRVGEKRLVVRTFISGQLVRETNGYTFRGVTYLGQ
ncbi:MAG: type II secretion system protein [Verrucomicrobia bacterium]|nr:type II secretion system protein [Verrucomicrobiota bacterium]